MKKMLTLPAEHAQYKLHARTYGNDARLIADGLEHLLREDGLKSLSFNEIEERIQNVIGCLRDIQKGLTEEYDADMAFNLDPDEAKWDAD